MRSNYRRIGDFIQLVDERNTDLKIDPLLGLSISKEFIPSVANTVGTNMANYKVIRYNQFACSIMQVRRDKKIPVALLKDYDEAIISQAYPVFEIIDTTQLLPDYLMMWMSRTEFDREACFYAVGGVRGSLEWEDFCDMQFPVPSIEKQHEIVHEYNTIVNHIKLNEQLNQKLEETAQAIYKRWFVDFEFPISTEQAASMGKPDVIGKPYKLSGGKMAWNEELGKEVPEGWEIKIYKDVFDFTTGKLNSNAALPDGKYPFFTCSSEIFKTNTYSFDCEALLLAGNNASAIYPFNYFHGKFDVYQRTYVITPKNNQISIYQGYFEILEKLDEFKGTSSGTATKFLTMKILNPLEILTPTEQITNKFNRNCKPSFERKLLISRTIESLKLLEFLILSKLATIES